jgi:putative transposase
VAVVDRANGAVVDRANGAVEELAAQGPDPALSERICGRRSDRGFEDLEAFGSKTLVDRVDELGSTIANQPASTRHPTGPWTTQTIRNFCIRLGDSHRFRVLIRDRAGQFARSFDTVLAGSGITAIRTPPRPPQANAHAERGVRTLRHELLDRTIIWNETQLRQRLDEYVEHYNTQRPHQGIGQRAPNDSGNVIAIRPCQPIIPARTCSGLINQYRPAA